VLTVQNLGYSKTVRSLEETAACLGCRAVPWPLSLCCYGGQNDAVGSICAVEAALFRRHQVWERQKITESWTCFL